MGGNCKRCGATRTDKQIGLEPTPAEFVAVMVEVFREVRRVMRPDATLWLNLGDSYAGSWGNQGRKEERGTQRPVNGPMLQNLTPYPDKQTNTGKIAEGSGLKPKDLIGIPWAVAKALQAPYYTGKIKDERDRVWLAAMIDGEGCIFIHKRKAGGNHDTFTKKDGTVSQYQRQRDMYGSGLEVSNTSRAIVERCMAIAGIGSICEQSPEQNGRRKQTIYRWNVRSNECRWILQEVYPHLVAKQHQARLAIGCQTFGDEAEQAHASLMALHNGQEPTIDFAEPASMFEPGFYLRQDIIWAKKNAMPESVTDRCTKSHEYLFLLTRSARYHYDADAIAEEGTGRAPGNVGPHKYAGAYDSSDAEHHRTAAGLERVREGYETKNRRSVWTVATQPFKEAHFATFPPDLIEPCIKAGCPKDCCAKCGAPVVRQQETVAESSWEARKAAGHQSNVGGSVKTQRQHGATMEFDNKAGGFGSPKVTQTTGWSPSCNCDAGLARGTVLDPFGGAGTTGLVADRLGRDAILIELNPQYAELARERIKGDAPLFAEVAA